MLLALALLAPDAPPSLADRCTAACGGKPCELIEFKGFSPDSTAFGHELVRCPGAAAAGTEEKEGEGRAQPQIFWHVNTLGKGSRKLPFSPAPKNGERFPGYYFRHDYQVAELPGRNEAGIWDFDAGEGVRLTFYWRTENKVAWYLEVRRDGKLRYTHRREFDEIYFSVAPRVFLSPDRRKAALVLSLDAMVKLDAGIAVFRIGK